VIERHHPTAAAVETPFHGVNVRSALALAHARGVVLEVLAAAGVPIHEYSPAEVKKAVTGNGRAEKGQVQRMICALLVVDRAELGTDVADALAVALCHLAAGTFGEAVNRAVAAARAGRSVRTATLVARDAGRG
jgi:crossover junction endodeoxyribonuclease RuvC